MSESENDELFADLVEGAEVFPGEHWVRASELGIDAEEFEAVVRSAKERNRQEQLQRAHFMKVYDTYKHHGGPMTKLPPEVRADLQREGKESGALDESGEDVDLGPLKYPPMSALFSDEDRIKRAARAIDKAVQRAAKPPEWRGIEYDPKSLFILDENARIWMREVRRESFDRWQRWNTITFQTELDRYVGLEEFDLRSSIEFLNALAAYWAETQYHATRRQHMDTDEMTLADVERLIAEARETDE